MARDRFSVELGLVLRTLGLVKDGIALDARVTALRCPVL